MTNFVTGLTARNEAAPGVSGSRSINFHDIIECLIAMIEARDPYTSGHSTRVADVTLVIAESMGLSGDELEVIHMAAHLHDIGKIGIPEDILQKPGALDPAEWALMRQHPVVGYHILSRSPSLTDIAEIVLRHHERWDGKGYPDGLAGYDIPLGSRIIALADSIDAMVYRRPYRAALGVAECRRRIVAGIGSQFDPDIADAALAVCFCGEEECSLNPETSARLAWFESCYGSPSA